MIALNKFEHLILGNISQKPMTISHIGNQGEHLEEWIISLSGLSKHQQYIQLQNVLSEVLVAQIDDGVRLDIMSSLWGLVERVVGQLHVDYIYEHQVLSEDRQTSIHEVRSLYFLMILVYKNIAARAYVKMHPNVPVNSKEAVKSTNWLSSFMDNLPVDFIKGGLISANNAKSIFTTAVYYMASLYVKVLREYALTYQKAPKILWQQLNLWYLRAIYEGVAKVQMDKVAKNAPVDCICNQYQQAGIASFANLFAYRRQDILNAFKVLPKWTKFIEVTFEIKHQLKVFVNLQGDHPPEMITPYSSVNPYSEEYPCLFFDVHQLIEYLHHTKAGEYITNDAHSIFEQRLAKMVLIAFSRRADQEQMGRILQQKADVLIGFSAIFKEMAGGESLEAVIRQRALPKEYHVQTNHAFFGSAIQKQEVKITNKNEAVVRFTYGNKDTAKSLETDVNNRSILQVFGLFALKSTNSTHKNPWRLGITHWVDRVEEGVEVDGHFMGRILVAAGVRLRKKDCRSQEFVHALLIDGDELNQQSTLIIPRFHFKSGDVVILRIDTKEIELRLERNLLSTDEIEQYQIVRLNG